MSLWDNLKKIAQPYGDDEYDDEYEDGFDSYEDEAEIETKRPEVKPAAEPAKASKFNGQVLNMNSGNKQEVVLFRPNTFNDTTKAAEDLRDRKAVIVNLENVDPALSRRVVDFLSGCAYALDGKINKVAQSTYLFCPLNMDVVGDLESAQAESELYV